VDFDSSSINQYSISGAVHDFCSMCNNNDTNHSITLHTPSNHAQEAVITNKSSSNAAFVAHPTIEEATNNPIIAAPAVAREY
jgi:hypothetical protein